MCLLPPISQLLGKLDLPSGFGTDLRPNERSPKSPPRRLDTPQCLHPRDPNSATVLPEHFRSSRNSIVASQHLPLPADHPDTHLYSLPTDHPDKKMPSDQHSPPKQFNRHSRAMSHPLTSAHWFMQPILTGHAQHLPHNLRRPSLRAHQPPAIGPGRSRNELQNPPRISVSGPSAPVSAPRLSRSAPTIAVSAPRLSASAPMLHSLHPPHPETSMKQPQQYPAPHFSMATSHFANSYLQPDHQNIYRMPPKETFRNTYPAPPPAPPHSNPVSQYETPLLTYSRWPPSHPAPHLQASPSVAFPFPASDQGGQIKKKRRRIHRSRRSTGGCYTCRKRHVKCDENHPICANCAKSNRNCVYPDKKPESEATTPKSNAPGSEGSSPIIEDSPAESHVDFDSQKL